MLRAPRAFLADDPEIGVPDVFDVAEEKIDGHPQVGIHPIFDEIELLPKPALRAASRLFTSGGPVRGMLIPRTPGCTW